VGKTALALAWALAALRRDPDVVVLFYSLDMREAVLYHRILCNETGIDYRTLFAGGHVSEDAQASEARGRLIREILPRLRVGERTDFRQGPSTR
jgi:replicative DNA helicase